MDAYALVKFLYVLLAVLAVGFNASYGIWLTRAPRDPQHLGHMLRGIKFLDDRVANPAYALLLVTGLALVGIGSLSLTTFWIAGALVLWATLLVVGRAAYTPTLRRQIRTLDAGGAGSAEYRELASRNFFVGIPLGVVALAIVFLMVVKPTL